MVTKYSNYSNADLLQLFEDRRQQSPIIEELCQRLEMLGIECPVCEADLTKVE